MLALHMADQGLVLALLMVPQAPTEGSLSIVRNKPHSQSGVAPKHKQINKISLPSFEGS